MIKYDNPSMKGGSTMGSLRIVQLTKLAHPLAPGTVAFSLAPSSQCEHDNHHRNPWSLLRFTGVAQASGTVKVGSNGKDRTYTSLWNRYLLFKVEPRAITELKADDVLVEGDFVAAFSYPCARALPFMFAGPAWLTTEGFKAYRTDLDPFGSKLCFTTNPAGWLLVAAEWNVPLDPQGLEQWQEVILYDYEDGKANARTFSQLNDGFVGFAGGAGGIGIECLGKSHWLFRHVRIPRVVSLP
ncbi:MAG TPA: hypothetical protein VM581_03545 [Magnetospirillaceae bacterium]|nr:hypothetical protein [Magnetospirillaceae bacterium]